MGKVSEKETAQSEGDTLNPVLDPTTTFALQMREMNQRMAARDKHNEEMDRLFSYFDDEVVHAILANPLGDVSMEDTLIWEYHSSGLFTILGLLQDFDDAQDFHAHPVPKVFLGCSHGNSIPVIPKPCYFKLYVDVALNDHKHKVGIGAVVTNSKGDIVASMSSPFDGILSPLFAEAKVLLWALRRCMVVRFPLDCIASDCQLLVHRVKHRWKDKSALSDVVEQILSCLSFFFPSAAVIQVPRNHNVMSHNLVKAAIRLEREVL
uniref:RNase H type-1 domain-containing protein n=1 Tax=Cannabis sativa TaxID=3483 RepID=A0A803PBG8_CANSA